MTSTGRGAVLLLLSVFLAACLGYGTAVQSKDAEIRQLQTQSREASKKAERLGEMKSVYIVCNDSRMSATVTEASCAALQDVTRTEFLCEDMGTSSDIRCWVEDKSEAPSEPFLTYPTQAN